jgi:3-isopropylmalate/(R)-2-methylmalate dehydratase small subunit
MRRLREIRSRTVVLPMDDVDTDQIIPARFLVTTAREGLGAGLFADWRRDASGCPRPGFALDDPAARGARILVAGRNFGCGSSREHAVWALQGAGFEAVIARSFADIFRANALKNGLVPIAVDDGFHAGLIEASGEEVAIDVEGRTITHRARRSSFPLEPFARHCLLSGKDELDFLLSREPDISAFEAAMGPAPWRLP